MRVPMPVGISLLCALALSLSACGGSSAGSGATRAPTGERPRASSWLRVDPEARTATVTLIAGYDASANGFNLDGAVKGALLFAVPTGWRVLVSCVNRAPHKRYSCTLTRGAASAPPAKALAQMNVLHPARGLAPGASTTFALGSLPPSLYRLAAVTEGSEPSGMWVVLEASEGGRPYARWLR